MPSASHFPITQGKQFTVSLKPILSLEPVWITGIFSCEGTVAASACDSRSPAMPARRPYEKMRPVHSFQMAAWLAVNVPGGLGRCPNSGFATTARLAALCRPRVPIIASIVTIQLFLTAPRCPVAGRTFWMWPSRQMCLHLREVLVWRTTGARYRQTMAEKSVVRGSTIVIGSGVPSATREIPRTHRL